MRGQGPLVVMHRCVTYPCPTCQQGPTIGWACPVPPTPTCRTHGTLMRYVAVHVSSKPFWFCDQCEATPRPILPRIDPPAPQRTGTSVDQDEREKDPAQGPHWSELPLEKRRRGKR